MLTLTGRNHVPTPQKKHNRIGPFPAYEVDAHQWIHPHQWCQSAHNDCGFQCVASLGVVLGIYSIIIWVDQPTVLGYSLYCDGFSHAEFQHQRNLSWLATYHRPRTTCGCLCIGVSVLDGHIQYLWREVQRWKVDQTLPALSWVVHREQSLAYVWDVFNECVFAGNLRLFQVENGSHYLRNSTWMPCSANSILFPIPSEESKCLSEHRPKTAQRRSIANDGALGIHHCIPNSQWPPVRYSQALGCQNATK